MSSRSSSASRSRSRVREEAEPILPEGDDSLLDFDVLTEAVDSVLLYGNARGLEPADGVEREKSCICSTKVGISENEVCEVGVCA
jgi:hypothetical protein